MHARDDGLGVRREYNGAGGAVAYGFCQARNASNVYGVCWTDNAELLDAIKSIGDYSYLHFEWRPDGTCRHIGVSTQSFYLP